MAYFCGLVLNTTLHIYLHRPEEIGKNFAPRHNYNILQKMFSVLSVQQLNSGSWIVFVTKRIWFLWAFTSEEKPYYSEQKHDTFYYFHVLSLIRLEKRLIYDTFDQFFKLCFEILPLQNPPLCSSTVIKLLCTPSEAKSKVSDWGIKSTLAWGKDRLWRGVAYGKCVGVDSGVEIRWESTPGSNRPCFSLDLASDDTGKKGRLIIFIYR
jgi:hypothetical protein